MLARVRRHSATIVVAFVTAAVTSGGPVVADMVYDATNAHKVDGRHAVGAAASRAERAGDLVATNADGRLPNDIIARAPDAAQLGGRTLQEVLRASSRAAPVLDTWSSGLHTRGKIRTSGGNLVLVVSATGYSDGDGRLDYDVLVDGQSVGHVLGPYQQGTGYLDHQVLPAAFLVVPGLAAGDHTVRLVPGAGTNGDSDDTFNVTAIELGLPDLTFECADQFITSFSGAPKSTTCRATSSGGLSGRVVFGCEGLTGLSCSFDPPSGSLVAGGSRTTTLTMDDTAGCGSDNDLRVTATVGGHKRFVPMMATICAI